MNREAERKRLVKILKENCHCINEDCEKCGSNGICFTHREADHLLDNGIVVPLVKVGQTVWLIKSLNWQKTEWGIKEGKISMIQQKADMSWKFRITENHSVQDYTVDEIGKTVFTSREEAQKALERRGEK